MCVCMILRSFLMFSFRSTHVYVYLDLVHSYISMCIFTYTIVSIKWIEVQSNFFSKVECLSLQGNMHLDGWAWKLACFAKVFFTCRGDKCVMVNQICDLKLFFINVGKLKSFDSLYSQLGLCYHAMSFFIFLKAKSSVTMFLLKSIYRKFSHVIFNNYCSLLYR